MSDAHGSGALTGEGWLDAQPRRPRVRAAVAYVATAMLAFVALAWDTAILTADLRKPLTAYFNGDGTSFAAMHFKGILEGGYYVNPRLGAPLGMDLRDFPTPDVFYLGAIWLLTRVTNSWQLAWNLLYIAGYPLAAVTALAVMRRYGLRYIAAMPSALLFAFVPYHTQRAFGHPHLGLTYFLAAVAAILPLDVLLGERCGLDPPPLGEKGVRRFLPRVRLDARELRLYAVALVVGLWGSVYYWFFAVLILLLAGVAAAASYRAWMPMARAVALAAVSTASFVAQTAEVILFQRAHGRVPLGARTPGDAETFALKITQLVLPIHDHRFEPLRRLRRLYDLRAPLVTENSTASVGLVASAGLAVLLVALLRGRVDDAKRSARLLWPLSIATFAAIFVGTVGGLGSLIAFLGFADVRSYGRISIYIAFFAAFAVGVLLDRAFDRTRTRGAELALGAAAALGTAFGLWDTTWPGTPDYAAVAHASDAHGAFVSELEARLPRGAMVLQLPYVRFPEADHVEGMDDYAPMLPYLYAKELRWSYGALRDRRGDDVYARLAALAPEDMLDAAVASGFSAVFVIRPGYKAEVLAPLEQVLRAKVGAPVVERWDHAVAVWSLVAFGEARSAELGSARVDALRRATLEAAYLGFREGFYPRETTPGTWWRWAKGRATLVLENPTPHSRKVELVAGVRTADPNAAGAHLVIDGVARAEMLVRGDRNERLALTFDLPPGEHIVTVRCDARPLDAASDWRDPVFLLQDYALRDVAAP